MPNGHKTIAVLGLLLIVVGLPFLGRLARHKEGHRCALDGVVIEPIYRVRIVDDHNQSHEFCCLKCAQLWQAAHGDGPCTVMVTDEASGQEISSAQAYFAISAIVTTPTTGNRIHVFGREADAQKHADKFSGRVLKGKDRPFQELE